MKSTYRSNINKLGQVKITVFTNSLRGIYCLKYLKVKKVQIKNIVISKKNLNKLLFESETNDLIDSFKTIECKKYLANILIYDSKDFKEAKKLFKFRTLEGQLIRSQIAFKEKNYSKAHNRLF